MHRRCSEKCFEECIYLKLKKVDNNSKFQIENDNNIQLLKKKISDFQNASLILENRKKFLQEKMMEVDKEIRLLNNDHGILFNFKMLF